MSFSKFMAWHAAKEFELVEGTPIRRREHGALASLVSGRAAFAVAEHSEATRAGHLFASGAPYRCFGHPDTVLRPGITFVRRGRFPGERIPEGAIEFPADLAILPVFPSTRAGALEARCAQLLAHGFGELWVLFPDSRTVHVRRPGEPAQILDESATLTGRGPLAGFACTVRELFPPI